MSACPEEATLRLIGSDLLGDETYSAIEQHVEDCPDCKVVLERLAHRRCEATADLPRPERLPRIPGFEIERLLDRGAASVVYVATEIGLNRPVALKVLPGGLRPDASADPRRRWLREAQAISSVRHPNVVPLYDYGEADGWLFLVLEYIPGGTLKQRMPEPLPPRVAAGLMETIARAVEHLHKHGLIHLALKPSNILLDGECDGTRERLIPRISDFGLALSNDGADASDTSLAGVRGTPSYMAPEQAGGAGASVGASADIHALGAILYELLTGRPPFQGTSTLETLDQVRGQNPVPPPRLDPKIPRDLETIALKCLEKITSRRYATAQAMADDLRRWLDGRPIQARSVSPVEHGWRWCRRRPAITALAGTLMTTLAVGFVTIVLLWSHAEVECNRAEQERSFADRERDRAETGYKAARDALAQILDQGTTRLQSKSSSTDRFIVRAKTARRQILDLGERRPSDLEISKLAYLDVVLRKEFEAHGKTDEARLLNAESLSYWERVLRKDPFDQFAQHRRFESAVRLAEIVEGLGNAENALLHLERASQFGECIVPAMSIGELGALAECRRCIAGHKESSASWVTCRPRI
jgi:hypothetical protein